MLVNCMGCGAATPIVCGFILATLLTGLVFISKDA